MMRPAEVGVTPDSLDRLGQIARAAGAAILAHYDRPGVVSFKDDRSPLTEADRSAHCVIVDGLLEWDRTIPVISEEGEIPPYEERSRWDRFWLVDPLDGTKEFLHRNGEFTVNIALVVGDAPVLGVVYAPALDLLYSAGRGLGAWKEQPGAGAVRVYSEPRSAGTPLVVAESRSHPVGGARGVSENHCRRPSYSGRQFAQVLLGRRGESGHLSPFRDDDGMGYGGGRLRVSSFGQGG